MVPGVAESAVVGRGVETPVMEPMWKRDLGLQARIGGSTRHAEPARHS